MNSRIIYRNLTIMTLVVLIAGASTIVVAQDGTGTPDPSGMRDQIRECLETGAGSRIMEQTRQRIQDRLEDDLEAGRPVDLVLAKLREGLRKHASDAALEQAVRTMSEHVGFAVDRSRDLVADGASDSDVAVRMIAQNMWSGLSADDVDHLCTQARSRLRDGDCSLADVAGAAETTLKLRSRGVEAGQAVRLAGEALGRGYDADGIHLIGAMAEASSGERSRLHDFLRDLEDCLGEGMASGDMVQHMIRAGWLGQGGMQEMGGNGPGNPGQGGPDDPGAHHGGDGMGGTGNGGGHSGGNGGGGS